MRNFEICINKFLIIFKLNMSKYFYLNNTHFFSIAFKRSIITLRTHIVLLLHVIVSHFVHLSLNERAIPASQSKGYRLL